MSSLYYGSFHYDSVHICCSSWVWTVQYQESTQRRQLLRKAYEGPLFFFPSCCLSCNLFSLVMFDFLEKHVFCLVSIQCLWFPLMFCVTCACTVRVKCVPSQCSSHACLSNVCWPLAVLLVWDLHCTPLVAGKDKGREIFHGPYASVLKQDAVSKRHWNTAAVWCCSCVFWYFRLQYVFPSRVEKESSLFHCERGQYLLWPILTDWHLITLGHLPLYLLSVAAP